MDVDASDLDRPLPCPLCGYDLRGLPAGRCPECGHAFDPDSLRREEDNRHPYLFEHHARRWWWSLLRTWLGMARPGRFWRRLRPEMPVQMRPLVLFALLMTGLAGTLLLGSSLPRLVNVALANRQQRIEDAAYYASLTAAGQASIDSQYRLGGRQAGFLKVGQYLNPPITSRLFWQQASNYVDWPNAIVLAVTAAVWPWLTLATLMIFRQSLRQARVGRGHLLRCCAYSSLPLFVVLPLGVGYSFALTLDTARPVNALLSSGTLYQFLYLDAAMFLALLSAFALCGYALWRAYRRYLRFPHAFATVLASQIVVWLTTAVILTAAPRW